MERFISFIGIFVIIGLCYVMSTNRKAINWRTVIAGISIQFFLGILLLKEPNTAALFKQLSNKVAEFLALSMEGGKFIFGPLADPEENGWIFFVQVIPTIIFFSAFISILYYFGIVQKIIIVIAKVVRKAMGTSGSETFSCSANIFVGQTEAPLLIKPYLDNVTRSELNAIMVGGFATVAGGVLAAYISFGIPASHLIVASVMAAPGALALAKIVVPETEESQTSGNTDFPEIDAGDNMLDAASKGTTDGLMLSLNVCAMLISFIALIAVADWVLGYVDILIDNKLMGFTGTKDVGGSTEYIGIVPGSLRTLFGYVFAPLAFILGVPQEDVLEVGNLLGQKLCLNEFVAYLSLSELMAVNDQGVSAISERSQVIATYALCGFANLASIGIQIGGIGTIAPKKRKELTQLGFRAMITGLLVSCINACIAGFLI